MNLGPPEYLSEMPSDEWLWRAYGGHWSLAKAMWSKRFQLVRLAEAQNWRCCYCGTVLNIFNAGHPQRATREHVVPKSLDGSDDDENIVVACNPCNSRRGNGDAYSFRPPSARVFLEGGQ